MKTKKILCACILTALLLSGCTQQQSSEYIGAEQAAQLALSASGISSADAESITSNMDSRNGIDYYKVTFKDQGQKYEYMIDAMTGVVIESHVPDASNDANTEDANTDGSTKSTLSENGASGTEGLQSENKVSGSQSSQSGNKVSSTQSSQSGNKASGSQSSQSGSKVSGSQSAPVLQADNAISADDAKKLALSQVPGASESDIKEFETDYDDGRMEYEGKIYYNNMEYEFEIDAYSGAFRSWEAEPIDD